MSTKKIPELTLSPHVRLWSKTSGCSVFDNFSGQLGLKDKT